MTGRGGLEGGSVYLETVMPNFSRALALGGIALGYSTALARLGGAVIEDASPAGAFKISLDRQFSRRNTGLMPARCSSTGSRRV